jgi:hypothetical protein
MLARSIGGSYRIRMSMRHGHACCSVSLTRAQDLAFLDRFQESKNKTLMALIGQKDNAVLH